MSEIKNIEGLSTDEINRELERGGKFVIFQYCFSIIVMTFKRSSDIYFIRAGESTFKYHIGFTLVTLLFGWWGIPWGPIYSIGAIFSNFRGGKNITQELLESVNSENKD